MSGTIPLFAGFNISAPGADTGIVNGVESAALTLPAGAVMLRVHVSVTTSSVVNVTATDGTTTHKWGLNASAALNAADAYTFEVPCDPALTYDVEVETDGVVEQLIVQALTA